jgi:KaiC/GvpD/RAD55 family RecA-like ATPase
MLMDSQAPESCDRPTPADEVVFGPYGLHRLDLADQAPIEWLWQGRIPLRKVTLLIGDPGVGKSFLALDLAARVSRGEGVPPEAGLSEPGSVLLLSADDDAEDTVVPRLVAAGATLKRIGLLSSLVLQDEEERPRLLSLVSDLDRIRICLEAMKDCRLLVIDPISAYLADGNNNAGVRQVLLDLADIARKYSVAVLLISHHRKQWSSSSLSRALGAIAFTAVARSVLTLIEDPTSAGRRLLLPAKMSLHATHTGRAFQIGMSQNTKRRRGASRPAPAASLRWDPEPIPFTAGELTELVRSGDLSSEPRQEVAEWLRIELTDGPKPATEIHRLATERSIPSRLLYAARKQAGIRITRNGRQNRFYWQLAEGPDPFTAALLKDYVPPPTV